MSVMNPTREELLTGRSLTLREYLDAVLLWVERHYEVRPLSLREHIDRRADLRGFVQQAEVRRMLQRYGAGDEWSDIRESAFGGRLE
jgi:hypothetical protein